MSEDDELGRRLGRALEEGLRSGHVDTTRLLGGARAGARRLRRRRAVASGVVAALVVAVPVGIFALGPGGSEAPSQVASDGPTSDVLTSEATPTPTPTAVAAPDAPELDATTLRPDENAVDLPPSIALTPADVPVPVTVTAESPQRRTAVVNGQDCDFSAAGVEPIAGLFQGFSDADTTKEQQVAVYVTVTAWSRGQGTRAYAETRAGSGQCVLTSAEYLVDWTPSVGQQGFQLGGFLEANEAGTAVLRVGDVLVGVQTSGAPGELDYVAVASQLAETVAQRVTDARVPGSSAG